MACHVYASEGPFMEVPILRILVVGAAHAGGTFLEAEHGQASKLSPHHFGEGDMFVGG
jgi:hypothetical protein